MKCLNPSLNDTDVAIDFAIVAARDCWKEILPKCREKYMMS
jgi:hypothetical protein